MRTTQEIREEFLKYFEEQGHRRLPSSSLIPAEDPTLMFVNAGMVQFKNVFLGLEKREYDRAATAQKCLRISGKHNDFEAVGRTPRHHTFFEMLGNFSFGDYFKRDAISFAWEFITEVLKIPQEKLWVTIYKEDDEAGELWLQETALPKERLVKLGEKDNFWSMGDIGPCGPCTEIHYDRGEAYSCGENCGLGHCECDRYTEIWNLVFMQYNRDETGKLTPLPKPSVDTGMGLERIAAVLQGVDSNYETDLFKPLIGKVEERAGIPYDKGDPGFPFRVIADHIRSSSFLIADGVLPGNEGRGYILRRIIRRAVRYGRTLGLEKPFLHELVDTLEGLMGSAYPELTEKKDFIIKVLRVEEERFLETLSEGLQLTESILLEMKNQGRTIMKGEEAFQLYDTYGFPVELTEDVLKEHGCTLDSKGFREAMEAQRELTRIKSAKNEFRQSMSLSREFIKLQDTSFLGYDTMAAQGKIIGIFTVEGIPLDVLPADETGILITDQTPFYGESGGQIGDQGWLLWEEKPMARVEDARKSAEGRIYHIVTAMKDIRNGQPVLLQIEEERRRAIMRNHSATHLLHRALHQVLGEHATQKGSYVDDHYLRFDFSHYELLTEEELVRIEDAVNRYILSAAPVMTQNLPVSEAKKLGAMMIFGEKYGDTVRVVEMGEISKEFCGGTHVSNTSQIGSFRILGESSIGAGLRRIEAVTGLEVLRLAREKDSRLKDLSQVLKVPARELLPKAEQLVKELKELKDEKQKLSQEAAKAQAGQAAEKIRVIQGIPCIVESFDGKSMEELRDLADLYRDKCGSVLVVLGSREGAKASLLAAATKDLVAKGIHAGNIIRAIAPLVAGGGGGRAEMAQAGGKDPKGLEKALDQVENLIESIPGTGKMEV